MRGPMTGELEMAPFPRGEGRATRAVPGASSARSVLAMASLLLVVTACVIAAYPFLADRFGAWQAQRQFSEQQDAYGAAPGERAEQAIAQAQAYNVALAGGQVALEVAPYDDQLESEDGIICWLDVPKLGLKVPVRHGTGNDVLMAGAGHIEGSSLPVGGEPSNVVVTGHSGMRHTRMFDQLDLLEEGDAVVLWTCGQPYAYEVDYHELVAPDQVEVVDLPESGELLTLITCRPIGVNSHRLVVHAHRVAYDAGVETQGVEHIADSRTALFGGACIGVGAAVWLALLPLVRRRRAWWLNRVLGERPLSERDVAALSDDLGDMKLQLRFFRRARLSLFGDAVVGRWRRVRGERGQIELDFGSVARGGPVVGRADVAREVRLPRGPFKASALDGELCIEADYLAARLVFAGEPAKSEREGGDGDA